MHQALEYIKLPGLRVDLAEEILGIAENDSTLHVLNVCLVVFLTEDTLFPFFLPRVKDIVCITEQLILCARV